MLIIWPRYPHRQRAIRRGVRFVHIREQDLIFPPRTLSIRERRGVPRETRSSPVVDGRRPPHSGRAGRDRTGRRRTRRIRGDGRGLARGGTPRLSPARIRRRVSVEACGPPSPTLSWVGSWDRPSRAARILDQSRSGHRLERRCTGRRVGYASCVPGSNPGGTVESTTSVVVAGAELLGVRRSRYRRSGDVDTPDGGERRVRQRRHRPVPPRREDAGPSPGSPGGREPRGRPAEVRVRIAGESYVATGDCTGRGIGRGVGPRPAGRGRRPRGRRR